MVAMTIQGCGGIRDNLVHTGGDLGDVKFGEICGTAGAEGINETQAGTWCLFPFLHSKKEATHVGGTSVGSPRAHLSIDNRGLGHRAGPRVAEAGGHSLQLSVGQPFVVFWWHLETQGNGGVIPRGSPECLWGDQWSQYVG